MSVSGEVRGSSWAYFKSFWSADLRKPSGLDFGSEVRDLPDKDLCHTSAEWWSSQGGKATLDPRRPCSEDDRFP